MSRADQSASDALMKVISLAYQYPSQPKDLIGI